MTENSRIEEIAGKITLDEERAEISLDMETETDLEKREEIAGKITLDEEMAEISLDMESETDLEKREEAGILIEELRDRD